MKDMKLALKLSLGFGLVLILTVLVAYVGYDGLQKINLSTRISEEASLLLETLSQCQEYQWAFESYGFEIVGDAAQSPDEQFETCVVSFNERAAALRTNLQQDQDIAMIDQAQTDFAVYTTAFGSLVEARRQKDQAFADWADLGWTLTTSVNKAMGEEINPAIDSARRTREFDKFLEWSGIGTGMDQNVVQPFLLLRVTAMYLVTTNADEQWKAYQDQLAVLQTGIDTWADQVRSYPALTTAAQEIRTSIQSYELAGTNYYAAILQSRQADKDMVTATKKVTTSINDLRDQQVQAMEAQQNSSMQWANAAAMTAVIIGVIAAVVITLSIVRPVAALQAVSERMATGDINVAIDVNQKDEIGRLAMAFRNLVRYIQQMAESADHLAVGDVAVDVTPQSDKDVLGLAFQRMVGYQQQMARTASYLAQGDLTVTITPQTNRDVLGNAVSQMIANLRELVGQVQRNANEVALAAQQINSVSEQSATATGQVAVAMQQIARGASQQSERVMQTTAMVQQVSHAIEGVARGAQEQSMAVTQASNVTVRISGAIEQVVANAHTGADSAARTAQTAQSGAHTIESTIRGMETIKQAQDEARRKVTEMGTRAEEIGVIVVTIEKIADQTNLLALNAAIEAARAGEHGKGFAVVADEVRRLAENAGQATQEIVALVKGIQKSVAEAIQAMQAGAVEVDAGVVRSREAGHALGEILGAVSLVNQQMTDIAHAAQQMSQAAQEMVNAVESVSAVVEENTAATEEMASGAEEVLGSIEDIAGITEENSASVEEVSASVEEVSAQAEEVTAAAETLKEMAQDLQKRVAQFKLPGISKAG